MAISKKSQPSKKSYKVTFTYETKFAKNVQVLGDFNAWDANAPKMKASKGNFTQEIELPAGSSFQFRYLIDGQAWDNDSKADYYVDSPFAGIQNSVVVLDALQSDAPSNKASKSTTTKTTKKVTKEATAKVTTAKPAAAKKATPAKSVSKEKPASAKVVKAAPSTKSVEKTATKKAAPKAEAKPATKKATPKVAKADDLKKIEGIGPKIAELLKADGITTFAVLAKSTTATLKSILEKGGSKFLMHDPSSWAQQADLAANGKWEDLKTLQDKLVGGKKK